MKFDFSVTGLGICTAESLHYEDHIATLVTGRVRTRSDMPAHALEHCVGEALDGRSGTDVIVLTDAAIDTVQMAALGLGEQRLCPNLAQMLTDAQPLLLKNRKVLLLAHQPSGYISLLLEADQEVPALARVNAQLQESGDSIGAAADLTAFLTTVIEIRYALLLDNPEHYNHLWDWSAKRKRTLQLGPVKLRLSEAKNLFCRPYRTKRCLIPVSFRTVEEARMRLERLARECTVKSLSKLMAEYLRDMQTVDEVSDTVVFCVTSAEALQAEIAQLLAQSDRLLDQNFTWKSEGGSVYRRRTTSAPKVVFMTPTGGSLIPGAFYPRYARMFQFLDKDFVRAQKHKLIGSGNEFVDRYMFDIITNTVATNLLNGLGIAPDYMTGASMGELSIDMIHMASENGHPEIAGYQMMRVFASVMERGDEAATAYLGRKPSGLIKHYLKCDADRVEEALKDYDSVYQIVKCSPENVIISGEPDACNRLIQQLGCVSMPLDDPNYIHTPVMEAFYEEMYKTVLEGGLYLDVDDLPYKIYCAYSCKPIDSSVESWARNFADLLVKPVDFTKTLNSLYDEGCRVFVDLSSRELCSLWSTRTLGKKSDFAVINTFAESEPVEFLLNLAIQLLSSHIPFDYSKILSHLTYETETPEVREECPAAVTQSGVVPVPVTAPAAAGAEDAFAQVVRQQLINNENAFRMYMEAQNALYTQLVGSSAEPAATEQVKFPYASKECLYNREQVITMTDTSMAAVLGDQYKDVDQYPIRARMPLPPFLFVSRIISIDAEYGVFRPSSIVTEFDLDADCVFRTGESQIGPLVASEASHIAIFLIAYMGLDAISKGTLSYRAIDSFMTAYSDRRIRVGDTLRTVLKIERFVQNGATTLLFFNFESYINNELYAITEATGGFFTKADLASNKGVIKPKRQLNKQLEPKEFLHFNENPRTSYEKEQMDAFFRGDYETCFGVKARSTSSDMYYLPCDLNMVDRVTNIDYNGGTYGRGLICGEKQITPDMWPFKVHFKNDPVFPAIIVSDGVTQLGMFLFTHAGLLDKFENASFTTVKGNRISSKFRGQVRPGYSTLRYEINVKEVIETEEEICAYFDAAIYNDGVQIMQIDSYPLKITGTNN